MDRIPRFLAAKVLSLCAGIALVTGAHAAVPVELEVPMLAAAGNAPGFEFKSLEFFLYLMPIGDPESGTANVFANNRENYTFLSQPGCSGRPGSCTPPPPVRVNASTSSATFQNVTSPPSGLKGIYHFSGADVAGMPLDISVQNTGAYTLMLTADSDPTTPITSGTPLSDGAYTLTFQTQSLLGSQITMVSAVPEPEFWALMLVGFPLVLAAARRRSQGSTA